MTFFPFPSSGALRPISGQRSQFKRSTIPREGTAHSKSNVRMDLLWFLISLDYREVVQERETHAVRKVFD